MNNLKDIHNKVCQICFSTNVVLSGCQWTIWRIYTTQSASISWGLPLFYQDVNEQFEGYTQHTMWCVNKRIVVLSGCQWTIWRIYTTSAVLYFAILCCFIRMSMNNLKDIHNTFTNTLKFHKLFYQDVNEQFEGYTQPIRAISTPRTCFFIRISKNNLPAKVQKIYESYKFIRKNFAISRKSCTFAPTNLKDIHNKDYSVV